MSAPDVKAARDNELSEKYTEFMMHLGVCISRWSLIDAWLFRIFRACIGGTKWRASSLFYKSPQISEHINMADFVVTDLVHERGDEATELAARWKTLKGGLTTHMPFRNLIAHNPVLYQGIRDEFYWNFNEENLKNSPSDIGNMDEIRFRIVTEQYKMQRRRKDHTGKYPVKPNDVATLDDMKAHLHALRGLETELVTAMVLVERLLKQQSAKAR